MESRPVQALNHDVGERHERMRRSRAFPCSTPSHLFKREADRPRKLGRHGVGQLAAELDGLGDRGPRELDKDRVRVAVHDLRLRPRAQPATCNPSARTVQDGRGSL